MCIENFKGKVWLHRKVMNKDSKIWQADTPANYLKLFLYLIMRVNYRTVKKEGRTFRRGEFVSSLDGISEEAGMSRSTVVRALKWLKDNDYIDMIEEKGQFTHLRIKNYDIYQVKTD